MKVKYARGTKGSSRSNIIFEKSWPMKGGKFPKDHPCADNPQPMTFGNPPISEDSLGKFRACGYPNASCFPEGDGICFDENEKTDKEVIDDIEKCFGWKVEIWRVF